MGSQLTLTVGEQQEQGYHRVESEPETEGNSKAGRYNRFTYTRSAVSHHTTMKKRVQKQRSGSADTLVVATLACGNEEGPISSQKVLSLSLGKQGTWPGIAMA